ncbi:MAG: DUF3419 family protein [Kibdelosporangium sp.]
MASKTADKWILYSTCDEDSDTEMRALRIESGDRVLSVTGSGCRTLSLLVGDPESVVSVDSSPGQSRLLELKLAAIRHFDYDSLLAFLGVDPCQDRWKLFEELRDKISAEAYGYFAGRPAEVKRGLLVSGRHEKLYTRVVAPTMKVLYPRAMRAMFAAKTIEEQRAVYRDRVDGLVWRTMIRKGFSERTLKTVLNDPGYDVTVDVDSVGDYVLERVHHTFNHHMIKDNDWVAFMFTGKYPDRETLPHFLLRDNYEAIRAAGTKVEIVTENLITYLEQVPDASYDKFSLSDVTSCIGQDGFSALMRNVGRTAKPGAQICYRSFLAKHKLPDEFQSMVSKDEALSAALTHDDKAFVYDIEVLSVKG